MNNCLRSLRQWLVAVLLLVGGVATSSSAHAYVTNGAYFNGLWALVPYKINAASFPASVGTQAQVITAIRKGVNHWNFESNAPITFVYVGTTTINTRAADGTNVIYYDPAKCVSALGPCLGQAQWWPATGPVTDFDITFNGKDSSNVAIPWSAIDPPLFKRDLWGYTAHEFGHPLGLAHSAYPSATMYATASLGATFYRFLSSDDIIGIQTIYGVNVDIQASNTLVTAGTPVTITMHFGDSWNLAYEFRASTGTSPGYNMSTTDAVDYRVLKLNTPWTNMAADPTQYTNITGTVDASGNATMTWNTAGQAGQCLNFAGLVTDASYSWPNNTRHISNPIQVCVQ